MKSLARLCHISAVRMSKNLPFLARSATRSSNSLYPTSYFLAVQTRVISISFSRWAVGIAAGVLALSLIATAAAPAQTSDAASPEDRLFAELFLYDAPPLLLA
ncbi:MAG: hypothetical protein NTW21_42020 [Verrucomicrobia bacterium]|nr:hypothetical protein [Verrucomicrobiota bacterium]